MKKKICLVSALIIMAMSAMFVGCKDKTETEVKNELKGCTCEVYFDGYYDKAYFSISEMKSEFGAKTCLELAQALKLSGDSEASYRCYE